MAANVVFLGDSITAGYGVSLPEAYPSLIAARIAEEKLPFRVVNAGVSGETTADGLRRIGRLVDPDTSILVIALGANDALRQIPPGTVQSNLIAVIMAARAANPRVVILLCGMRIFENFGLAYARSFAEIFPRVARETRVALLPFLLEGVGGNPTLNQSDGLHPSSAGQRIVADNVWEALSPLLKAASER